MSSIKTYCTPWFYSAFFLSKEIMPMITLTLFLLLLQEVPEKVTKTPPPSCLRQASFKLRLSINTDRSVLVRTCFRGQRSHLGHSFCALGFCHIFHWGQSHKGFVLIPNLCLPQVVTLFLLLLSDICFFFRFSRWCCVSQLSDKSLRWQNYWNALQGSSNQLSYLMSDVTIFMVCSSKDSCV